MSNVVDFACLVRHLRFKYRFNSKNTEILNKIMWFSVPVVYGNSYIDACAELDKKRSKVYRVKKRVLAMMDFYHDLYFGTVTFSPEFDLSAKTKERYLKKYLNELTPCYVANEDYGAENGRLHYHCIVANPRFLDVDWQYGYKSFVKMKKTSKDGARSSKYLSKVFYHAGKVTAGKVIFSRNINGMYSDIDELPF